MKRLLATLAMIALGGTALAAPSGKLIKYIITHRTVTTTWDSAHVGAPDHVDTVLVVDTVWYR